MKRVFLGTMSIFLPLFASVGCLGGAESDSCETVGSRIEAIVADLPGECSEDADCAARTLHPCTCSRAFHKPDDGELDALLEEQAACTDYGCNNVPYCRWTTDDREFLVGTQPACMGGVCRIIPNTECSEMRARPIGWSSSFYCSNDSDCVVRTDTNACGCSEAILASEADAVAAAVERSSCDLTAVCAALDCPVGTVAVCDEGLCTLTP